MESLIGPLIGLASGALGGNVAGKAMNSNMGTMGRSLTGIIGGGGLAALAPMIGLDMFSGAGGMNITSILSNLVGGGVGGGILTAILGKVMGGK
ncbi:MAG: hypothetical protein V3U82_05050 [Robiginitomaculum sp.]